MGSVLGRSVNQAVIEIESYCWLVDKIIGGRDDSEGELSQAGMIGLWEASRRYDPVLGPFSSYASFYVSRNIDRCLRSQGLIKVPEGRDTLVKAVLASAPDTCVTDDYSLIEMQSDFHWRDFRLILLHVEWGLSLRETATATNDTYYAVQKRWTELKKKLQQ